MYERFIKNATKHRLWGWAAKSESRLPRRLPDLRLRYLTSLQRGFLICEIGKAVSTLQRVSGRLSDPYMKFLHEMHVKCLDRVQSAFRKAIIIYCVRRCLLFS